MALDDFIIKYLDIHTQPMDFLMENKTLYQVFVRSRDINTQPIHVREEIGIMILLKTFINLDKAIRWVYENGKKIVDDFEDVNNEPYVLTIVYMNDKLYDEPYIVNPHISQASYLTYAFSKEGWYMIKDEFHYNTANGEYYTPYWLNYISNGTTYRYSIKDLDNLYEIEENFDYEEAKTELLLFLKNPNKYIKNNLII